MTFHLDAQADLETAMTALVARDARLKPILAATGMPALRRRAQLNAPRLRDAIRTALANYSSVYYRVRTAPSPTELTRQMQAAVDRVLGAPGARVLLANIIYQRPQSQ
jgi:DNA-3-methyladenine glycosylase II